MNQRRISLGSGAELVITWDPSGSFVSTGGPGIEQYLDGLKLHLQRNPQPLMEKVGQIMRASFRRNFEVGGRPPWSALAPSTVARKRAAIAGGAIPRRTPTGRIPRRLLQVSRSTGQKEFSALTILIATGRLRDSWGVKGAAGNVSDNQGSTAFFGSQLTTQRVVPPGRERPYQIFTKKALRARQKGQGSTAAIPLARLHEEGTVKMPARPVGVMQPEDLAAISAAGAQWVLGE